MGEWTCKDYNKGYQAGYHAALRGQKNSPTPQKSYWREKPVGYGLTSGQIRVIKTQVALYDASYEELALHYKVPENSIKMVVESVQFGDIEPIKTKSTAHTRASKDIAGEE